MRGRILVIDSKTPTPDQDSGSTSTFSYLRILVEAGFEVTFAPYNLWKSGSYGADLNLLGVETLFRPPWWSINRVIDKIAPRSDVVLLYRGGVAGRLFDRVRRAAPSAKILFHPVDLSFLRMQRQADVSGDRALAGEAEAVRVTELSLIARADATIVVSAQEKDLLRQLQPNAVVHHIPILRETPPPPSAGFQSRRDFLFVGGFDHTPNVDAMNWFVREVWPLVRARGFGDRFIIAGSEMPGEILALASDRIEVRGHVRDLAPLFAACRLSIAPLRYGAGVKGKIVSSLSFGVPVVATSIAAEGMGLRHGDDILVADAPEAMADHIIGLYGDEHLWRRLSSRGYQAFQDNFSLASGGPKVVAVVDGLVAARHGDRGA